MFNRSQSSRGFWSAVQDVAFQGLQIVDVRLALVIGLLAFMLAVGVDSAGNPAAAADLVIRPAPLPVSVTLSPDNTRPAGTLLSEGDAAAATAQRLRHGALTSAILTSNRLTEAHFFTDLPR